jgi:hypothetical protein
MKKLKNEVELVKAAISAGSKYVEDRGAAVFEPTDSAADKILYIYRLLVQKYNLCPRNRSRRRPFGTVSRCGTHGSCLRITRC